MRTGHVFAHGVAALLAAILPAAVCAQPAAPAPPEEADWRTIPDAEIMILTLSGDRRVVIRLAPTYAPEHVANVRALVAARWWDGTSVYRVQDNWVAQWGDATEKKPLPPTVLARPAAEYDFAPVAVAYRMRRPDAYSQTSGISADGWALAGNGEKSWLAHCYGTVGVARDNSPDTGTGSELFAPIGGSARRLDRNYTVVGRVIEGMQFLSALPRSSAAMGFYATRAEDTPILSVRLASDLPPGERPRFQYRSADNPRFADMVARREEPAPPTVSLGGLDVCDVPLEVRQLPPA